MNKILVASGNPGKLREIEAILANYAIEAVPAAAFAIPEVEETGLSFIENAILKARHASRHAGLPALADDSGLEVDSLGGAPGIYSARYAGPGASDADNNAKLLAALRDVPPERRTARFRCVMAVLRHADDPSPFIAEGVWEGVILEQPRGTGGFGYDPLFLVPERGRASAELAAEEKNRLSHRARALHALAARFDQLRLG
jgi:XTP/dITP diphosphohydrolase